ncbi:helix-turn-helix domain-containing protein [Paremcibacter congregatus]|uniref:helix-turn-helix domain-containing protein n=1 Tax=Paremcibacter congregatus TaxID=2043170 RepID=UPI003A956A4E
MNQISTGPRDWSIRPDTPRNASLRKTPSPLNCQRGRPSVAALDIEQHVRKAAVSKFATTRIIFPKGSDRAVLAARDGAIALRQTELRLFVVLANHPNAGIRSDIEIAEVLWPDPDAMPDYWASVIQVTVAALRKKLRQVGSEIEICTMWWRGYCMKRPGMELPQ